MEYQTRFFKSENEFSAWLSEQSEEAGGRSLLICIADSTELNHQVLNTALKKCKVPVTGGVFPELIVDGHRKSSGILVLDFPVSMKPCLIPMNASVEEFIGLMDSAFSDDELSGKTMVLLFDAFGDQKTDLLDSIYNYIGNLSFFIGGGAGSLSFQQKPCIVSNDGMKVNTAVLSLMETKVALGVAHGWTSVSEPLKVTKAAGTTIYELNWKPAFDVYRQIINAHSGISINPSDFFPVAKSYPLGISKMDSEMIVRDPISSDGEVLVLVDEVSQGEFVEVLHGAMDDLLNGASRARQIAEEKLGTNQHPGQIFTIDCISRVLYMQDDFSRELNVIGKNTRISGALTIGEIANSAESYLEIFNKTVVVSIFHS